MNGVLVAELAVFLELDTIGIVFLVLHIVVVALFALGASQRDTRSRGSRHCLSTPSPMRTPCVMAPIQK
jgi:hypothetical protein